MVKQPWKMAPGHASSGQRTCLTWNATELKSSFQPEGLLGNGCLRCWGCRCSQGLRGEHGQSGKVAGPPAMTVQSLVPPGVVFSTPYSNQNLANTLLEKLDENLSHLLEVVQKTPGRFRLPKTLPSHSTSSTLHC